MLQSVGVGALSNGDQVQVGGIFIGSPKEQGQGLVVATRGMWQKAVSYQLHEGAVVEQIGVFWLDSWLHRCCCNR